VLFWGKELHLRSSNSDSMAYVSDMLIHMMLSMSKLLGACVVHPIGQGCVVNLRRATLLRIGRGIVCVQETCISSTNNPAVSALHLYIACLQHCLGFAALQFQRYACIPARHLFTHQLQWQPSGHHAAALAPLASHPAAGSLSAAAGQ
jgi:hypothetical protein